ncbi:MAG TPA: trypsin-like serine protease, partial [Polyangiaceae bacterium]|nr:trypsin-like serine protease [Polyangiaceae bacterium]
MRLIIGSGLLSLLAVTACSAGAGDGEVDVLSDGLVGGHVAAESEYPATVSLGGCTGVKVGPRHFLSAAHCFSGSTQSTLSVTTDNNAQNFQTLTISSINIHPEYQNCSACSGDGSMSDFGFKPDAALIVVQELTPNIPTAVIDSTPVAVGAAVTLTGYGCENGVGQPSGPSRLKVGDTHSINPLSLSDATSIAPAFVTTYGPGGDSSSPGLCPGDSGGPLFRTGTNKVIGINALVS